MTAGSSEKSDLERAFHLQGEAIARDPYPSQSARKDAIRRLLSEVESGRDGLKHTLALDCAKPPTEVDLTEVAMTLSHGRHALKEVGRWMRPRRVRTPMSLFGTSSRVRAEPRGRVLVLSPWNYPLNLTFGPLISLLAAGNRAILKPSEKSPHTTEWMRAAVARTFDPSQVALVSGGADVAQLLLALPFDHVFFTGSTRVGRIVRRAVAEHDSTLTLELGGKSPVLVGKSANLKNSARKVAWGKFTNAGQTCIAPDYVLVEDAIADEFVNELEQAIRESYGDEPESSPDLARIIDDEALTRIETLIEDARTRGARCAVGGTVNVETRYVAPTVLVDVPLDSIAMREEIFGPVLPVIRVRSLDEALSIVNRNPRPLASYLFTSDRSSVRTFLERSPSGGSCINETLMHFAHPALPFGGVGASGTGRAHGRYGFETFSNLRSVMSSSVFSRNAMLLRPPFGKRTRRLVELILRFI